MLRMYLIIRVYPPSSPHSNYMFGWAYSKATVKAFFEQRDPSKYEVKKIKLADDEEIPDELNPSTKLAILSLKSNTTGENVKFLTTDQELMQYEKKITKYFKELPNLSRIGNGDFHLVELFINLREEYKEILDYIGYRPPEVRNLFDDDECCRCGDEDAWLEEDIGYAYIDKYDYNMKKGQVETRPLLPSVSQYSEDVALKLIYSAESFIKICKEDL